MGTDKDFGRGIREGTAATYVEKTHYKPKQHSRCSVLVGKLKERSHLEDLGADGRTILKWMLISFEGVDWIYLALDRDKWRALVNAVINLRVP